MVRARPGRRFVEVAEHFGANGYVHSICSEDWTPALRSISEIHALWAYPSPWPACADAPEPWREAPAQGCDNCGETDCELLVELLGEDDQTAPACPDALYADLDARDTDKYRQGAHTYRVLASDGTIVKAMACPIPELAVPRKCDEAAAVVDQRKVGWFYCEEEGENFDDACADGEDNDGDGAVDCADDECTPCPVCGGDGVECETGCRYGTGGSR